MTIDPVDSGGNRAPPPPFSTQRKRPAINNLGVEISLNSDAKTPETPTPNINTASESSKPTSEIILQSKHVPSSTSVPSIIQSSSPQYEPFSVEGIRDPLLVNVFDALTDFQNNYDVKSQKIIYLENQLQSINYQLNQREIELQQLSSERISNFNTLEVHKKQLKEFKERLGEFEKYETLIASKFTNLEELMSEMCSTKAQFLVKEKDLQEELVLKEKNLSETSEHLKRMKLEKESAETKVEMLENDIKEKCTDFNGRIYNLNVEIREKEHLIEDLSGEKEILLADLKNITIDRDKSQKECSWTLKELTDLAVNEKFSCDATNLGSLERTVKWLKGVCLELSDVKTRNEVELITLKENLQELQRRFDDQSSDGDSKQSLLNRDNCKLRTDLEQKEAEFNSLKADFYRIQCEVKLYNVFKEKASDLGFEADDWMEKIIEKLTQRTSERKIELLTNEINNLKMNQAKETENLKEEFSRLLREETVKIKSQRDVLEAELDKMKREKEKYSNQALANTSTTNQTQVLTSQKQSTVIDPDLTAIIRDLKETSGLFPHQQHPVRSSKRTASSTNANSNSQKQHPQSLFNKKRHTANTNSHKDDDSFMKSPSSVNSNDIWNLFK